MDMDQDQRQALLQINQHAQELVAELLNGDTDVERAYQLTLQIRADSNILKGYLRERMAVAA